MTNVRRDGGRRRIGRAALLVVPALAALGLGCSGDDDTTGATAPSTTGHVHPGSGSDDSTGATAPSTPGTDACASTHTHHLTMMWNPTMADEMTALGCPWPYEPYLAEPSGAAAAPGITAPYEARDYAEIWSTLAQADVGVCSVATLADPAGPGGFTFGFTYSLAAPGCPAGPTAQLEVREYVSVGDRDAAALARRDEQQSVVTVLGRWSVALDATGDGGDAIVAAVADALIGLGGQTLAD